MKLEACSTQWLTKAAYVVIGCICMVTDSLTAQTNCVESESPIALFQVTEGANACIPTYHAKHSIFLAPQSEALEEVQTLRPDRFSWPVTLPDGHHMLLDLERFVVHTSDFEIGHMTQSGVQTERYDPTLLTYRLVGSEVSGTLAILKDYMMGTFRVDGTTYELAQLDCQELAIPTYALFAVTDAIINTPFTCGTADAEPSEHRPHSPQPFGSRTSLTSCVEVALDIDFHTYNTFGNNCNEAVEWALALLAGVTEIYEGELDELITLSASYINVWEETDPYAAFVGNAGGMLDSFRTEWLTNPNLENRPRDLVHLLTRRTNTGTGGIAYVNVVCNSSYAVGFSSSLSNAMSYTLTNYSWNLQVVAHELGHNFGSNHTHWCGWPGGPIDNCYNLEGDCTGYPDNPSAQVGTIMSYCHAVSGGSVNLEFHPTVENSALIPTINTQGWCYSSCDEFATSCSLYGCTLPLYCNYDPEAQVNDGSCTSEDACGVCGGDGTSCIGCTDPLACNYEIQMTVDDGSCFFAPGGGACDCEAFIPLEGELNPGETQSVALSGFGFVAAVTVYLEFTNTADDDTRASDFTVILESPDGNCRQIGGFDVNFGCNPGGIWPSSWESTASDSYVGAATISNAPEGTGTWFVRIGNGWSGSAGGHFSAQISLYNLCLEVDPAGCMDPAACNYNPAATQDDGSCDFESCFGCIDTTACNYSPGATMPDESCEYTSCLGCIDPSACNFDIDATAPDDSCEYLTCAGCSDIEACNYDPAVTIDDGSCFFDCDFCGGDLDGDGMIGVSDVLLLLSDFGCDVPLCIGDANFDDMTNVSDLLILLSTFGDVCSE